MNRLIKVVCVLFLVFSSLSISSTDVQAEGNIEAFVTRLYTLCLNRTPDAKGKSDWVNQLRSGQKSAAEVVRGFFFSNEMKNRNLSDGDYVETCYRVMMNRGSDDNGKYYWSDKILYQDRSVVVKGFIDSQEFTNICKQYGLNKGTINTDTTNKGLQLNNSERIHCEGKVKEFVERCYTKTLGRASDTTGLNHWIKKITSGEYTPARVAAEGFYHSKEFVSKYTSNEEYIKILYRTFLGREAEASGYTYWLEQIKAKSRDQILNGFANSKEFNEIINGYVNACSACRKVEWPKKWDKGYEYRVGYYTYFVNPKYVNEFLTKYPNADMVEAIGTDIPADSIWNNIYLGWDEAEKRGIKWQSAYNEDGSLDPYDYICD